MLSLSVIPLSIFAGLIYHLGGLGDDYANTHKNFPKWIFNTKVRDMGVPMVMLIAMAVLGNFVGNIWCWVSLILSSGLLFLSLCTYNKWVGYFFNRKDKSTVYWESWAMTGLLYGLAMLPYAVYSHDWVGFGIRTVLVSVLTCLWSEFIGKVWAEEGGRGLIIIVTLVLL